ncbi:MAG: hypothetical protein HC788_07805 [Sphingopyxis sp.]|nr:hypothetical protein [Sphingopyxis sp.]
MTAPPPTLQAEFLGHLAATTSVTHAARLVGMSTRAAYDLRQRDEGLGMLARLDRMANDRDAALAAPTSAWVPRGKA